MRKINLGSGTNRIDGFDNVDKYAESGADFLHDLEEFPWPWDDNSVDEIVARHILEHLGETTEQFKRIIQELYRICCDGAVIHIAVPHAFSVAYVSDPTHVRPITPELFGLFSRKNCAYFAEQHASNSPLAVYWNVDMEIVPNTIQYALDPAYEMFASQPGWEEMAKSRTNFVQEIRFDVRVIKGEK